MRWMMVLAMAGLAGAAEAQIAGLTLPVDGATKMWDMGAHPPRPMTEALPATIAPGRCYILTGTQLHLQRDRGACLEYYIYHGKAEDLPAMQATGRMAFNDRTPDQTYRGLQLNGTAGVGACGADCGTLNIAGFASRDLARAAMAAAREGQLVTLIGREIRHPGSRAIMVERIVPAP